MDITTRSASPARIAGITRKSLDNPRRPKQASAADAELAEELHGLLRRLPALDASSADEFPLLAALFRHDAAARDDLARPLLFIAAATHSTADERRTAEYLLRNRCAVVAERRSALCLLSAARCAAEMDVRRVRWHEIPTPRPKLEAIPTDTAAARCSDRSVGETVLDYLHLATGHQPATTLARSRLLDAIAVALELSGRHALNGGEQPSVLAMRSDARKDARLVTYLRQEFGDEVAAVSLARLLVGAAESPVETSLLWCAAQPDAHDGSVPPEIRHRWVRDLIDADRGTTCGSRSDRRRARSLAWKLCSKSSGVRP